MLVYLWPRPFIGHRRKSNQVAYLERFWVGHEIAISSLVPARCTAPCCMMNPGLVTYSSRFARWLLAGGGRAGPSMQLFSGLLGCDNRECATTGISRSEMSTALRST